MRIRSHGYALVFICSFAQQPMAQQWLSQLPPDEREQPTIDNLRQAFERYYREHPVDLRLDKLAPTFRFEGAQEEKERMDVEEYKLFQRWLWLVEPRAYPTGRLDLAQITTFREQVKEIDDELMSKQTADSPLMRPSFRPRWRPLGPPDAVGGTNMGRANCIEFDSKNVKIFYLCAADGRLWKSTNSGASGSPQSDSQPTFSACAI